MNQFVLEIVHSPMIKVVKNKITYFFLSGLVSVHRFAVIGHHEEESFTLDQTLT